MIGIALSKDNSYHNAVKRGPSELTFDGVDDYIETDFIPSSENLGQAFTWEFWNYYNTVSGVAGSHGNDGSTPRFYTQVTHRGILRVAIGDKFLDLPSDTVVAGKWTHIAHVFDRGTVYTYVDGILVNKLVDVIYNGHSTLFNMGRGYTRSRHINGRTKEHRIWTTAKSQQEIIDNMNKELKGNEPGHLRYWKLNEGAGNNVREYSVNTSNRKTETVYGAIWKY
ncbi:LamG domain-containing protein [Bacillus sp. OK048]|uniref:LamG domain-containing protein n=1 Tax=Bacillus sp. OK048 TaxID=1882761 RepID=UPI000889DD66|nr:LamG domain-containing protein [Bacillus sp. OK048]SDM23067.1 Concanavalin A-like lectin/glucanases superfamily protein [Bacillus sp. OK048]